VPCPEVEVVVELELDDGIEHANVELVGVPL
jgi:hypothetical protein